MFRKQAEQAGDENLNAECFILFNEEDLDKHFILLNQTKINEKEVGQIWRAIRNETRQRKEISLSALDIARNAGWSDAVKDIETRIKTAVSELEHSGFIQRGQNMPRIYANSINVKNMDEASVKIDTCGLFDTKDAESAKRIMKSLISSQYIAKAGNADAESRVDYMSDNLAIVRTDVIRIIGLLRQANILSDDKDFIVFAKKGKAEMIKNTIKKHSQIENALINKLWKEQTEINLKAFLEEISENIPKVSMNDIKAILNYLKIKKLVDYHFRSYDENISRNDYIVLKSKFEISDLKNKAEKRAGIATKVIDFIYNRFDCSQKDEEQAISFSRLELLKYHKHSDIFNENISIDDVDDALFYLLKIRALKIEGEFLVVYNRMHLKRIADTAERYKKEHYKHLEDYYDSKTKQIHIVGEYAKKMLESESAAVEFVDDYFFMQNDFFMHKYFAGRNDELKRNMTKAKYKKLFSELSDTQLAIIEDKKSQYIVVAAGPGSGKTKLLTHKLASLYMTEDVKHEQMIMLTFSRAAASEFKKRLMGLIGNAANYITISTFYSYCFDLLGRVGNLEKADSVIRTTIEAIKSGEIDRNKTGKLVLVIDEAQDISGEEYELISLLMQKNEEMRVIAVGDDDQSIYEFRGASPQYLKKLSQLESAVSYELIENYRSKNNLVEFANRFIEKMPNRLKIHSMKAKTTENGIVQITKHKSDSLILPVVEDVLPKMTVSTFSGSVAVLARTNDEVLQIATLLNKKGIHTKIVGDTGSVKIGDLAEMRYFYSLLNIDDTQSQITQENWEKAIRGLKLRFASSEILLDCLTALADFDETNNKSKYINDLNMFFNEARFENFIRIGGGEVFVSTIHQAKGREFDNVFLSLSGFNNFIRDEDRRASYVAITRAKNNLFIHYNKNTLDDIQSDNVEYLTDCNEYGMPDEIAIQLNYKSVFLDAFFNYQNTINNIYAGAELSLDDTGCRYDGKRVLSFSTTFKMELEKFASKGYNPVSAKVSAVVYWKKTKTSEENRDNNENMGKEAKIILPVITLVKNESTLKL